MTLFSSFCMLPFEVKNVSLACHDPGKYIKGPWSTMFLYYSLQLTHRIFQFNQTRAEVVTFDSSFFEKVWYNIKGLFYASWMFTYTLIGEVVLLILILIKCLLQHIQHFQKQQAATVTTLQVLMSLRYPSQSPLQEVLRA